MKNTFHKNTLALTLCLSLAPFLGNAQAQQAPSKTLYTVPVKIRSTALPGMEVKEDAYSLRLDFGKIKQEQFRSLANAFQADFLVYQPNKEYGLVDFLPSHIGSVLGKRIENPRGALDPKFVSDLEAQLEGQENSFIVDDDFTLGMNCHSLSWQWIRYWQNRAEPSPALKLYGVEDLDLYTQLEGFEKIQTIDGDAFASLDQIEEAKFGDILLFSGEVAMGNRSGIYHSAIYIGAGLVMEKIDFDAKYFFRVAFLHDVFAKYKVAAGSYFSVALYRIAESPKIPAYENLYRSALPAKLDTAALQNFFLTREVDRMEETFKYRITHFAELQPDMLRSK